LISFSELLLEIESARYAIMPPESWKHPPTPFSSRKVVIWSATVNLLKLTAFCDLLLSCHNYYRGCSWGMIEMKTSRHRHKLITVKYI
jgi:hypothetical protein